MSTVLMVASRPSTISLADDVVYLEAGRVADHGTHADTVQEDLAEAADEGRTASEGEAVTVGGPEQARDRDDHEHLHQQAQQTKAADPRMLAEQIVLLAKISLDF